MSRTKKITHKKRANSGRARSRSVRSMRKPAKFTILSRLAVPMLICVVLGCGIAFFGVMGYRSATASGFFSVKRIDVRGVERASGEDVRRIVQTNTERTGVWLADLPAIREKVEKLPFVRSASVSMELPSTLRVSVIERVPIAVLRLSSGDVLSDGEGYLIAGAAHPEATFPFILKGWDESKSEKPSTDNLQRLKIYRKIVEESLDLGVAERIREVNLADLREPVAVVVDSGRPISVALSRENLGKSLKMAIESVSGKGERVRSVNASGVSPILEFVGN